MGIDRMHQGTNQLSIQCGIHQLCLRISQVILVGDHGCSHRFSFHHPKYPQYLNCVLPIFKENITYPLEHLQSQKLVNKPDVLHLKLQIKILLKFYELL